MRQILHILTDPKDSLAHNLITRQRELPDVEISVVDLSAPDPNYSSLLEAIFRADSVEVW